jgi:DNA mismatch repair protein MutS2
MDEKILGTLEYYKVLRQLEKYCVFSASSELAQDLKPISDYENICLYLSETSEAKRFLRLHPDFSIGGARDIRKNVILAERGGILETSEILDIKYTLIAARNLCRRFDKHQEEFHNLFSILKEIPGPTGVVAKISSVISDDGEIFDSASIKLSGIRRDLVINHERLLSKLKKIIGDSKNSKYLQEPIITQRDGRYVIPLRSEYKGRIKSIIHDQSSSGATIFIEPVSVVSLNNKYRELHIEEDQEIRRILAELSANIGQFSSELCQVVNTLARFDFTFAKAKYAEEIMAEEPRLYETRQVPHKEQIHFKLLQARHPLLDQKTVVPIDVELAPGILSLVITGPNTGGKTVTLKTIGLLVLMAQSGLHIPAQLGSEISVFRNIFADIGDEQSIEQSLSTFSSHIKNIIRILSLANQSSLVLLDELGAGTDPQEGAALARAILEKFVSEEITTIVTTHHPQLKIYAHSKQGVLNASVEFDIDTLKPTYRLIIGLPGRSNALAIAERLGLMKEIIDLARSDINPDELKVDDLLDEILEQRELAKISRNEAEFKRVEIEKMRFELIKHLNQLEKERLEILTKTKKDAENELEQLREEIKRARLRLKRARQPLELLSEIEEDVNLIEANLDHFPVDEDVLIEDTKDYLFSENCRSLDIGTKVSIKSLGKKGIITSIVDDEIEVQVGILRIRTKVKDLSFSEDDIGLTENTNQYQKTEDKQIKKGTFKRTTSVLEMKPTPGIELDLRGLRADEALERLESYIDSAFLSGLPFARIIHGKGTGKLRSVVRSELSSNSQIESFEGGKGNEGGDGVTIIRLKQ